MMNIAYVNATRKWGGVKTWMLEVAHALQRRGHQAFVYARQPEFVEAAQARLGHGEAVPFGPDGNPFAVSRFIREFRKRKVDAVFINVEKDLATAGLAARLLKIPVIQRVGMPDDIPLRLKTRMLHAWIKPFFFCPCVFIAGGLCKALPYVSPERVRTQLTAKPLAAHGIDLHTPRRLIMTQQLNPDKGHAVIFEALSTIATPFVLHVVGTGSCEHELREMAGHFGLEDKVRWHGFRTDVGNLLAESDMFILASFAEGLPNTLLEALAHGLLPITRDVGGIREVMTPVLEPWIVPADADAAVFRRVIEQALALDDQAMRNLREQARKACDEHCNLDRMIDQLETWLEHEVRGQKNVLPV